LNRIKSSIVKLGESYVVGKISNDNDLQMEQQQFDIINSAKKQAEEILKKANEEASRIIDEANLKAQEMFQKSNEVGFQAGYKAGYNDAKIQVQNDFINQIKSVEHVANSALSIKKEIISSSEKEILQLTISIAEKIIRQKLEFHPEILLNIVKSAINSLRDKEEVSIILNPIHIQNMYDFSEELKQTIKGLETVKIMEDRTIPVDGVIIETTEKRIDAGIGTQIAEITRKIMAEVQENPSQIEIPKEIIIDIQEPSTEKEL